MRTFPSLLLLVFLSVLTSCIKDSDDNLFDDDTPVDNPVESNILQLDGPNQTAPFFPAGTHRFAVRFDPQRLAAHSNKELTGVRMYLQQPVPYVSISAHYGGTSAPGRELARIDTEFNGVAGFYDFFFDAPVAFSINEPLWLVAEVELSERQASVGCDNGPSVPGGDWVWTEGRYQTFQQLANDDINWNIRGLLTD